MMRISMSLFATLAATSVFAAMEPGAALPAEHHQGSISYMSGGIGLAESTAMKREARNYPLELLFVARQGKHDDYLADMPLTIKDANGAIVFKGPSEGPYFLARPPAGRYTVISTDDGHAVTRHVDVARKGTRRGVLEWKAASKPHSA